MIETTILEHLILMSEHYHHNNNQTVRRKMMNVFRRTNKNSNLILMMRTVRNVCSLIHFETMIFREWQRISLRHDSKHKISQIRKQNERLGIHTMNKHIRAK